MWSGSQINVWQKPAQWATLKVAESIIPVALERKSASGPFGRTLLTHAGGSTWLGKVMLEQIRALLGSRLRDCLESEAAEEFLEVLLRLMQITTLINPSFRENVTNFSARYQFLSRDRRLTVAVIFDDGWMCVRETTLPDPDITLTFSTGRALLQFLLTPNPDLLASVLRHEVEPEGNLNYLYKFAYLARRLQSMVIPA
ncbi:MAG: hypothetical protein JRH20_17260 [Deltaproteobacteria bacterium]|nr:hypothetical protein [Deltaproteobacteria bacterium]